MSCLHPLRAFPTGAISPKGKPVYFVTSHKYSFATADDFIKAGLAFKFTYVTDFIEIPCGRCIGCRKAAQKNWAFRMLAESFGHSSNYFLTLTYDDEHCPVDLSKRDLQLFNKRLRSFFGPYRFFCCGEYGGLTLRPHFHGLYFFDSPVFGDLKPWSRHGDYVLFNSETLNRIWGKGFVVVGALSPASCAYCAKYCLKPLAPSGKSVKPFIVMSRRPGLGSSYFLDNLQNHSLLLPTGSGSFLYGSQPRYLKQKFNLVSGGDFVQLKELSGLYSSGLKSLDDFRDLCDYLEKRPLSR